MVTHLTTVAQLKKHWKKGKQLIVVTQPNCNFCELMKENVLEYVHQKCHQVDSEFNLITVDATTAEPLLKKHNRNIEALPSYVFVNEGKLQEEVPPGAANADTLIRLTNEKLKIPVSVTPQDQQVKFNSFWN